MGAEWRRGGSSAWQAAIGGAGGSSPLILSHLAPATWYEIRISVENHAGRNTAVVRAATTTLTGGKILNTVKPCEKIRFLKIPLFFSSYITTSLLSDGAYTP